MKKAVLIPIIVGGALLTSFVAFFVTGVVYNANTTKVVTNEYTFDRPIAAFSIDTTVADVEIRASQDETSKLICIDNNKMPHTFSFNEGILDINQTDNRNWFDKAFSFSTFETKVILYTPARNYVHGSIRASTGNISLPEGFNFVGSLNIETSTGNINSKANVEHDFTVKATTGSINVETVADKLVTTTSTGNITVNGTLNNLTATASTGNITLNNVIAKERFKITTSTGNVKLNDCDASNIDIKTSTGNVSGTLLSYKTFNVKTSTGKVNVPPSILGGNPCYIETSTGDINITIKE